MSTSLYSVLLSLLPGLPSPCPPSSFPPRPFRSLHPLPLPFYSRQTANLSSQCLLLLLPSPQEPCTPMPACAPAAAPGTPCPQVSPCLVHFPHPSSLFIQTYLASISVPSKPCGLGGLVLGRSTCSVSGVTG